MKSILFIVSGSGFAYVEAVRRAYRPVGNDQEESFAMYANTDIATAVSGVVAGAVVLVYGLLLIANTFGFNLFG